MEQHKYNIIDIARLAQVSTATVSRVLHEKGGYSKETETRVRRVIAECGFQLNKNAQGLRTQKSRNIGVIEGAAGRGYHLYLRKECKSDTGIRIFHTDRLY